VKPLIIADTSALNYLILIKGEGLLPQVFGRVAIARVVERELASQDAPEAARVGWPGPQDAGVCGSRAPWTGRRNWDLVDFAEAVKRLQGTSFRRPAALLAELVAKHRLRRL
jgi:hypothetical protein